MTTFLLGPLATGYAVVRGGGTRGWRRAPDDLKGSSLQGVIVLLDAFALRYTPHMFVI